ncbi:MAG: translesion DNA synthesis-associated protein ImuA [Betaproteobacteria bacterium]|nr:translesion DNA synthesis-associated protein ImuA [Betaproteobacteria bacterium]
MPASAALQGILQQQPVWRGRSLAAPLRAIASGYDALDAQLPGAGWPVGALTEILGDREGVGELQVVLPALARLTVSGKRVVWLAPPHLPYAPALAAAGVDLANLAVVRAPGRLDALWAAEQCLRAGPCHALLAWLRHARYEELRRLSVAAEASQAFVALFRPAAAAAESSPAVLRLALETGEDGLRASILKRRGPPAGASFPLPVKRPAHALGRPAFPRLRPRDARDARRLDLPVHA